MTQQKTAEHAASQTENYKDLYDQGVVIITSLQQENESLRQQLAESKQSELCDCPFREADDNGFCMECKRPVRSQSQIQSEIEHEVAVQTKEILQASPKQEIEQKPDFRELAGGYTKRSYQIHLNAVNGFVAGCERIWNDYVSPLQSRIAELEQSDKEWRESHDALLELRSELLDRVKSLEAENEELRKKGEWISVKERLPEKGQWVLILSWRGILQASFWAHYWKMHELSTGGHEFPLEEVSHWQPLPSKPEN